MCGNEDLCSSSQHLGEGGMVGRDSLRQRLLHVTHEVLGEGEGRSVGGLGEVDGQQETHAPGHPRVVLPKLESLDHLRYPLLVLLGLSAGKGHHEDLQVQWVAAPLKMIQEAVQ